MSSDIEFYGFAAVKAIFSAIPNIGGSIASILGDIQSKRNEARLKDFLEQFAKDMESRKSNIQVDYVSSPDFIDIFMNITEDAMKQRQEEKRMCLKNLLVNSIITPDTSYDLTEELQRLIDLLSLIHFKILKVFYEDKEHPRHEPKVDVARIIDAMNPLFNGKAGKAGEVGKTGEEPREPEEPEEGGIEGEEHSESEGNRREDEDIVALIRDLENQGLVESFLNNMYSRLSGTPLVSKEPYITPKGRKLIEYVTL